MYQQVCHYHQILFHSEDSHAAESAITEILGLVASSEDQASMLIPVLLVSGLPEVYQFYHNNAISNEIMMDTLSDLELHMRHYRDRYGVWGTNNLRWLIRHFTGKIFRLGRLQFHFHPFAAKVNVFRHSITNETAIFSAAGVNFRRDGWVDGTNDIFDLAWTSHFEITNGHIEGHIISADGYAQQATTRLPVQEWKLVLTEGDTVLNVHIPAGSKMSYDLCQSSYKQAVGFFAEHFPERHFSAFSCSSWLLSPLWKNLLPAESNIVKFQSDYQLFPIKGNDTQTFERVFGAKPADLHTAPRDTLLQRVLLDHVLSGNHIYNGAGIIQY